VPSRGDRRVRWRIMNGDISIDVGSAVPYLTDRVLSLFHKDLASQEWQAQVRTLVRSSFERASSIQCVGMDRPIPISRIYQPSRLTRGAWASSTAISMDSRTVWTPSGSMGRSLEADLRFQDLIKLEVDAVVFAGPGRGKTTLLRSMYMELSSCPEFIPLLFVLRDVNGVDTLEAVVGQLTAGRKLRGAKDRSKRENEKQKDAHIILLIDGYDEISVADRKRVSHALLTFRATEQGHFFLTCRTFYDVFDLDGVEHFGLAPFTHTDSIGFIDAFSASYGGELDAESLLTELEQHGFQDFASHPLLLALVCILKSGPSPVLPRRAIGLIRRAIDTLTLRWDEAKGVYRTSRIPLDGEERVRCLMRIAFFMKKSEARAEEVEQYAEEYLRLAQLRSVDKRSLLREMAQWYGLLVEVGNDSWQFVHRTIQDFLAARFWVEDGRFNPDSVSHWNIRAAYAACLAPDASRSVIKMLRQAKDVSAFCECLYNAAPFDPERAAKEVVNRLNRLNCFTQSNTDHGISVNTNEDFYSLATPEFLVALVKEGLKRGGPAATTAVAYAMSECWRRNVSLEPATLGVAVVPGWGVVEVVRHGEPITFRTSDVFRV
jgi:hypothetical protein